MMQPCWDRTFNASPRVSGANLTPDRESPNRARANAVIDVDFSVVHPNRGRSDLRVASSVNGLPYRVTYRIDGPSGGSGTLSNGSRNITAASRSKTTSTSAGVGSVGINVSVPGNLQVGDRVCFTVSVGSPTRGVMDHQGSIQSGFGSRSSQSCTPRVVNWPYFKVFGNDVVSGGSFGSCGPTAGRVRAHSRSAGVGSSTQYAAFALDSISGFSSANLRPSTAPPPNPPTGLTFANLTGGDGGSYAANDGMSCLPDYFDQELINEASTITGSDTSMSAQISSELATPNSDPRAIEYVYVGQDFDLRDGFAPIQVAAGVRKVIFVDGSVDIYNNIEFVTNWTDKDDVPFVMFISRGITVGADVTQLDGVYVAQPQSNGTGGVIRTCDVRGSRSVFSNCQNPLVVNGAFVADTIEFVRTRGSLRDARLHEGRSDVSPVNIGGNCSWTQGPSNDGTVGGSTCAAEIISFSPEVFMSLSQLLTPQENFDYDSYVTLPPNL